MTAALPPESSNRPLETLSDQALLSEFSELVRQDQHRVASLLRHIEVIDRRKLWARQGYPSLFEFLVRRYNMSESTAGKRIGAARTARRFPILFGMVERGEIHLSGIHCLKAHLTPENHAHVLASAKHETIRQIQELVARLAPQPDAPSTLRALPRRPEHVAMTLLASSAAQPAPSPSQHALNSAVPASSTSVDSPRPARTPIPATSPPRSPDPAPLSPGRYRLQITLGQAAKDKLKQLQDLLAHQIPNGDPAAIVERALDALLTQVHKRKTGITAKPRAAHSSPKPSPEPSPKPSLESTPEPSLESTPEPSLKPSTTRRTRGIKVAVRREVWPRDDARCGFIGEDGHRCNETRGLEFAHRQPWGKGGEDTAVNLGLRCIAHNALEADRDYGPSFMASKRKREPLKVREPLARYALRGAVQVAMDRSNGSMPSVGAPEPASSWPRPPRTATQRNGSAAT